MKAGDRVAVVVYGGIRVGVVTQVHSTWFELRLQHYIGVQDFSAPYHEARDFRVEGAEWCDADDARAMAALEVVCALGAPL